MNLYAQAAPPMGPPAGMPPPEPVDTSWIRRQYCDIPYGHYPAQRFNVYLPNEGDGPFPTVIFFHGGGFSGGDRTDPQLKPYLPLVKHGLALVSADYRLSGEVVFPEGLKDCRKAIRYIRAHGSQWGLDTDRLALLGNSSGGNFVLMLLAAWNAPILRAPGEPEERPFRCAVTWFAPTDLAAGDAAFLSDELPQMHQYATHNDPWSPESVYLGGHITELDPAFVASADPCGYITADLPPVLMQHGRMDHVVHWTQSKLFADRAEAVCGPGRVTLEVFPELDHADPGFETEENLARLAAFFHEHMGA